MRKVREAAVMIDVQVRQHHGSDVARTNAQLLQLRTGLLLRFDIEAYRELKIGMPSRQRFQMSGRAGVDHDHAFGMFNRPGEGGGPNGPLLR
ncbi:MAG: hypothetical protein KGI48_09135 [Hyphomicrobiales bacterium]|nr:hypothetical protein [Hyphomicrobiales bacterium]